MKQGNLSPSFGTGLVCEPEEEAIIRAAVCIPESYMTRTSLVRFNTLRNWAGVVCIGDEESTALIEVDCCRRS